VVAKMYVTKKEKQAKESLRSEDKDENERMKSSQVVYKALLQRMKPRSSILTGS